MGEPEHAECQRLLLRQVDRQAQRLGRRYNLQPADRDDTFQEIALDAWRRLTRYKTDRGDLEPFLALVTRNQARKIEARFHRRRECQKVSLAAPIADQSDLTLEDNFAQEDGLPAWLGNIADWHAQSELVFDISRLMSHLPPEMQRLCACLAQEPPGIARRICGLSNTSMYRRIAELRQHFGALRLGSL
jgi:DNA-directed RNA polymerase specialized sigma24 family protein